MKITLADGAEVETVQKAIMQDMTLQFTIKADSLDLIEKLKKENNLSELKETDSSGSENTYSSYQIIKALTIRPELDGELYYISVSLEKNDYYNELTKLKEEIKKKDAAIEELKKQIDSTANDCQTIMDMVDDLMCNIIPVIDETTDETLNETTTE